MHSILGCIGTTVGWMLSYLYGLPLLLTIAYVAIGNIIATVLIGWPVFKVLKKTGIFQRWFANEKNIDPPREGEINEKQKKMRNCS